MPCLGHSISKCTKVKSWLFSTCKNVMSISCPIWDKHGPKEVYAIDNSPTRNLNRKTFPKNVCLSYSIGFPD